MRCTALKRSLLGVTAALLTTVAVALPMQAAQATTPPDIRFEAMAQADRDFAALSRAQGVKTAFLTYLAQDSVAFLPGVALARPYFEGRTFRSQLDWSPSGGEISQQGDLGYTFGPAVVTVPQPSGPPLRFGTFYLTLWERDSMGNWKIAVDNGVDAPLRPLTNVTEQRGAPSRPIPPLLNVTRNARLQQLTLTDRALARALTTNPSAFTQYRRADCVFLRDGGPRTGADADALLATLPTRGLDSLETTRMAVSGDVAFTAGVSGGTTVTHYLRVWRYEDQRWQLVVDLTTYA